MKASFERYDIEKTILEMYARVVGIDVKDIIDWLYHGLNT